eukprot:6209605-Pleurochrysis_carterae.AAC.3
MGLYLQLRLPLRLLTTGAESALPTAQWRSGCGCTSPSAGFSTPHAPSRRVASGNIHRHIYIPISLHSICAGNVLDCTLQGSLPSLQDSCMLRSPCIPTVLFVNVSGNTFQAKQTRV